MKLRLNLINLIRTTMNEEIIPVDTGATNEPVTVPEDGVQEEPNFVPAPVADPTEEISGPVLFEGSSVKAILSGQEVTDADGKVTHYTCSMEDGSTKQVPVELFK